MTQGQNEPSDGVRVGTRGTGLLQGLVTCEAHRALCWHSVFYCFHPEILTKFWTGGPASLCCGRPCDDMASQLQCQRWAIRQSSLAEWSLRRAWLGGGGARRAGWSSPARGHPGVQPDAAACACSGYACEERGLRGGTWILSDLVCEAPEVGPAWGPGLPHVQRSMLSFPSAGHSHRAHLEGGLPCFAVQELLWNVVGGHLTGRLGSPEEKNNGNQCLKGHSSQEPSTAPGAGGQHLALVGCGGRAHF